MPDEAEIEERKGMAMASRPSAFVFNRERSEDDLALFWQALESMFDHDRSAARGEMTARGLIVFEHESDIGNAPATKLFDRVTIARTGSEGPPRAISDYAISVNEADMPAGVKLRP